MNCAAFWGVATRGPLTLVDGAICVHPIITVLSEPVSLVPHATPPTHPCRLPQNSPPGFNMGLWIPRVPRRTVTGNKTPRCCSTDPRAQVVKRCGHMHRSHMSGRPAPPWFVSLATGQENDTTAGTSSGLHDSPNHALSGCQLTPRHGEGSAKSRFWT